MLTDSLTHNLTFAPGTANNIRVVLLLWTCDVSVLLFSVEEKIPNRDIAALVDKTYEEAGLEVVAG